jgi:hypothetical protein
MCLPECWMQGGTIAFDLQE